MNMYNNNQILIISGPCSLESTEQMQEHLERYKNHQYLRAGLYKLRTSAESFQGLREDGIKIIKELKKKYKFKLVSEVVSSQSLELLSEVVDIFQIGTRNMYNYELLKKLNHYQQPVLLKRGFSATLNEFVEAAKYINNSVERVILCERGIRSFEQSYRNTIDINAVAYLKHNTKYKVIVDPSHGTAIPELIEPVSLAAIAAGADGLLIESHNNPNLAKSDADQALTHQQLDSIIHKVSSLASFMGKEVIC